MKDELVVINAADYGLEESKAKQISDMFKPMLDSMTELEVQYNEVINREIEPETIKMAHDLRIAYVKIRTGTAAIHKDLKAFYLQGGRFVDGWKNAQLMASQGNEEKLKAIEDHFVNIEKERVAKLQEERSEELQKFGVDFIPPQLGDMDEPVWANYISGVKLNYQATLDAEIKAKEEQIAKEKAEVLKQKKIKQQNIILKREAKEREAAELIRVEKETKERNEREAKAKAENDAREAKESKERKAREEFARKEREEFEAKLKVERELKERIEAELKAKMGAELKDKADKAAAIQAELKKGDADKVKDLIDELESAKCAYSFKSERYQKMYSDVGLLIDKVINHINGF